MISPVPLTEEEIEKVSDTAEFLFTRERPHYAMFTATQMARALATIRALQAENAAQAEALKVAREALVHARDNLTPHPDQMLDEALAKIDALIDLVPKIAWFRWGRAEGFAAGQEAMRAECDRVALAHKSKTENGRMWYEGRDWAVIRISTAIRALPIDPPCKPEEEK